SPSRCPRRARGRWARAGAARTCARPPAAARWSARRGAAAARSPTRPRAGRGARTGPAARPPWPRARAGRGPRTVRPAAFARATPLVLILTILNAVRNYDRSMKAVSLAVTLALAGLAIALGGTTFPIEFFLIGPLLVAARGTPRATAVMSVAAL